MHSFKSYFGEIKVFVFLDIKWLNKNKSYHLLFGTGWLVFSASLFFSLFSKNKNLQLKKKMNKDGDDIAVLKVSLWRSCFILSIHKTKEFPFVFRHWNAKLWSHINYMIKFLPFWASTQIDTGWSVLLPSSSSSSTWVDWKNSPSD